MWACIPTICKLSRRISCTTKITIQNIALLLLGIAARFCFSLTMSFFRFLEENASSSCLRNLPSGTIPHLTKLCSRFNSVGKRIFVTGFFHSKVGIITEAGKNGGPTERKIIPAYYIRGSKVCKNGFIIALDTGYFG